MNPCWVHAVVNFLHYGYSETNEEFTQLKVPPLRVRDFFFNTKTSDLLSNIDALISELARISESAGTSIIYPPWYSLQKTLFNVICQTISENSKSSHLAGVCFSGLKEALRDRFKVVLCHIIIHLILVI